MKELIRAIPDYPKPGILFRDITPLLGNANAFQSTINQLADRYRGMAIDKVVAIESRGFIIGAPLAYALGAGFVPIRKQGKLPAKTVGTTYDLEYGSDYIEMHEDALVPKERVLLVDDLLATGGTAGAACQLIQKALAEIVECCFLIDLPYVGGRKKLEAQGYPVYALYEF